MIKLLEEKIQTHYTRRGKMITGLKRVLSSGNLDEIEKFILDKEYEYYTCDGDKLVDSYEDLEFQIPNYDLLTKALGIKDS